MNISTLNLNSKLKNLKFLIKPLLVEFGGLLLQIYLSLGIILIYNKIQIKNLIN